MQVKASQRSKWCRSWAEDGRTEEQREVRAPALADARNHNCWDLRALSKCRCSIPVVTMDGNLSWTKLEAEALQDPRWFLEAKEMVLHMESHSHIKLNSLSLWQQKKRQSLGCEGSLQGRLPQLIPWPPTHIHILEALANSYWSRKSTNSMSEKKKKGEDGGGMKMRKRRRKRSRGGEEREEKKQLAQHQYKESVL